MYVVKKILCPVDFSEASTAALGTAADLARRLSAELIVFHVAVPVLAPIAGFEGQAAYIEKLNDAHRRPPTRPFSRSFNPSRTGASAFARCWPSGRSSGRSSAQRRTKGSI